MSKKEIELQEQDLKNIRGGDARYWPHSLDSPNEISYPDYEDKGKLVKTVQTLEEALQILESLSKDKKEH